MTFEFDDKKSFSNKEKHGIDFVEAQMLWEDERRVEVPAQTIDELRLIVIGEIKSKTWTAVITYRAEKIRIISVRRARKREVELYESGRI